ncbi:DUF2933 domain-containing protein [Micromonospora globbae]|uniref:DUF2933 domain-containing protein n=1 Tax=Micromonospora globbae TaxID=1894969 RepID=A0A420EFI6_9ACTN|nr:DUF2933 domain-containing protein [Micromonospora globbae]RKF19462.1 DUF2933 domain-containing protein [Micromonospora globbae]
MRRQHLPLYAIALALLAVGALAVGVPARSLVFGLLVIACPLMMLFMHGGHGGQEGHGQHQGQQTPAAHDGTDQRPR